MKLQCEWRNWTPQPHIHYHYTVASRGMANSSMRKRTQLKGLKSKSNWKNQFYHIRTIAIKASERLKKKNCPQQFPSLYSFLKHLHRNFTASRCSSDNHSKFTRHIMSKGAPLLGLYMFPNELFHLSYFSSQTRSFRNCNPVMALSKCKSFSWYSKSEVIGNISCWYHTSWCP